MTNSADLRPDRALRVSPAPRNIEAICNIAINHPKYEQECRNVSQESLVVNTYRE